MGTISNELAAKIKSLPDSEKIELVDSILLQLDKPDPEIDRIWADEARKRWQAYKAEKLETVSYEQVMEKSYAMKVRFLKPAQSEVDDAFAWYEEQLHGLGRHFLDDFDRGTGLHPFDKFRTGINYDIKYRMGRESEGEV